MVWLCSKFEAIPILHSLDKVQSSVQSRNENYAKIAFMHPAPILAPP